MFSKEYGTSQKEWNESTLLLIGMLVLLMLSQSNLFLNPDEAILNCVMVECFRKSGLLFMRSYINIRLNAYLLCLVCASVV